MLSKIKGIFKKIQNDDVDTADEYSDIIESMANEGIDRVDYDSFDSPAIVNENGKKSLLILDDLSSSWLLYDDYFKSIRACTDSDPLEDFKIVKCIGAEAGFIAKKYLMENTVDYAILDVTLGYSLRIKGGGYEELDGLDIAFNILEGNPDAKIVFSSAHRFTKENPILAPYFIKFEETTGLKFTNYCINKNDDILDDLTALLYGDGEHYEIKYK